MRAILGYIAAGLALTAAVLLPFVLISGFTRVIAATGVRVDPVYGGGRALRTFARGAYGITVHEPVHPAGVLQRARPYVQVVWSPAAALPERVADEVDIDGDGAPDMLVRFDRSVARVDVVPRGGLVREVHQAGIGSFSEMIARLGERVVVRVPLAR